MNSTERVVIGIDASKDSLDYFMEAMEQPNTVANDGDGIRKLLKLAKKAGSDVLLVVESTGKYHSKLVKLANKLAVAISVVNPKRVRDYAKALGILGKTDQIDARIVAQYGKTVNPRPTLEPSSEIQALRVLATRRDDLVRMLVQEKNRLGDNDSKLATSHIKSHIVWIERNIAQIGKEIKALVKASEELHSRVALLESFKGVGFNTAVSLIVYMPELGSVDKPQLTALAGLAPFNDDSGKFKGIRRIFGGRMRVRQALYMATIVATRWNPTIKTCYQALRARGKAHKVAITACMRKILLILNSMTKNNKEFMAAAA